MDCPFLVTVPGEQTNRPGDSLRAGLYSTCRFGADRSLIGPHLARRFTLAAGPLELL
jgi:hypothetical protein